MYFNYCLYAVCVCTGACVRVFKNNCGKMNPVQSVAFNVLIIVVTILCSDWSDLQASRPPP